MERDDSGNLEYKFCHRLVHAFTRPQRYDIAYLKARFEEVVKQAFQLVQAEYRYY